MSWDVEDEWLTTVYIKNYIRAPTEISSQAHEHASYREERRKKENHHQLLWDQKVPRRRPNQLKKNQEEHEEDVSPPTLDSNIRLNEDVRDSEETAQESLPKTDSLLLNSVKAILQHGGKENVPPISKSDMTKELRLQIEAQRLSHKSKDVSSAKAVKNRPMTPGSILQKSRLLSKKSVSIQTTESNEEGKTVFAKSPKKPRSRSAGPTVKKHPPCLSEESCRRMESQLARNSAIFKIMPVVDTWICTSIPRQDSTTVFQNRVASSSHTRATKNPSTTSIRTPTYSWL